MGHPAPSLPSPTFAELVAKWEAITQTGHNGNTDAFAAFLMPEVLECIREQQAALRGVIRVADRATDEFDAARAVLIKYEVKK